MMDLDLLMLRRRMEQLLAPWHGADRPGCTIGVVRDGALILHGSAGQASLEHAVPIGPRTTFRIASVSKQFTCAAILMLAEDGRLAVDDDVRHYLPELPDCGHRVTLDHLMRNSSGMRDMLEIMRLGGTDLAHPCRPEDLTAAIQRQRTLNFAPGARFLYSNTNFWLLGLIVERIAGEPLAAHLDRRIFTPLAMTATRLTPSTAEIAPHLATGYFPRPDGGWVRAQHGFPLGGEGGLVSSVEDLALWDRNLQTGRVGGAGLATALEQQAEFTGGGMNSYARGLQVQDYRGLRTVDHGGLWPGYKTEFLRVPALRSTVICIANSAAADPYLLAHQMLDALVEGRSEVRPVPPLPPRPALARLAGRYVDRENCLTLELSLADDGTPMANMHGVPFALVATNDGRLRARRGAFDFTARPALDGATLEVEADARQVGTFHRVATAAAVPAGLSGRYASAEFDATWTIAEVEPGKLTAQVAGPLLKGAVWSVEPIEGDIIRINVPGALFQTWVDAAVRRDAGGGVTGLLVNSGRTRGVRFDRV